MYLKPHYYHYRCHSNHYHHCRLLYAKRSVAELKLISFLLVSAIWSSFFVMCCLVLPFTLSHVLAWCACTLYFLTVCRTFTRVYFTNWLARAVWAPYACLRGPLFAIEVQDISASYGWHASSDARDLMRKLNLCWNYFRFAVISTTKSLANYYVRKSFWAVEIYFIVNIGCLHKFWLCHVFCTCVWLYASLEWRLLAL